MALKLRATRPQGAVFLNDSSCAPAHNTPVPLERSPPASFKRMLGSGISVLGRSGRCPHTESHTARSSARHCRAPAASRSPERTAWLVETPPRPPLQLLI